MPFPAPTTFDSILGCLRLSHKYEVGYLRRRALVHLSSGYRTTLAEADSTRLGYNNDPDPSRCASEIISWVWPDTPTYRLRIIQLAREVEALWTLPLAFYNIAAAFTEMGSNIFYGAVYNDISLLIGHNLQITSTNADILQFLSYPRSMNIEGCESPTQCDGSRLGAIKRSREMVRKYPSMPLHIWDSTDWDDLQDVCPACLAELKKAHQLSRQAFWDKLTEMYGLPPWEELERMKEAVIGNGSIVL
ncbi:hypothetical protein C8R44DRAFT_737968 [Mycena epipterygia]|nr:hypothetical protein C8R44DRAFT_737968 [Mycena epipterygia]